MALTPLLGACESSYDLAVHNRCNKPIDTATGETRSFAVANAMGPEAETHRLGPNSSDTFTLTGEPARNSPRYLAVLHGQDAPRIVRYTQHPSGPAYSVSVSGVACPESN